jgi:hypothetical protein
MKEVDEQKLTIKNARWDIFFLWFFWHKSNINDNFKWKLQNQVKFNKSKARLIH